MRISPSQPCTRSAPVHQALEPSAVMGGDGLGGMAGEAGHARAQGLGGRQRVTCPGRPSWSRDTGAWTATARACCRAAAVCWSRASVW
jgi:hypothetical protein